MTLINWATWESQNPKYFFFPKPAYQETKPFFLFNVNNNHETKILRRDFFFNIYMQISSIKLRSDPKPLQSMQISSSFFFFTQWQLIILNTHTHLFALIFSPTVKLSSCCLSTSTPTYRWMRSCWHWSRPSLSQPCSRMQGARASSVTAAQCSSSTDCVKGWKVRDWPLEVKSSSIQAYIFAESHWFMYHYASVTMWLLFWNQLIYELFLFDCILKKKK